MPNRTLSLASEKLASEAGAIESLYNTDFYAWTQEQSQFLSSRDWN